MDVDALPVPAAIRAHFRSTGIDSLYPPQVDAVEAGICTGENVVAAIPTASGKTLIAELAMLTADGPALYICPLRALASEKHATFDGLPGINAGLATGEYDSPAEELGEYDVVVATSEKVDSAIRNGASWVDDLACIVIDEVHLLESARRGPTLEVTVAMLRRRAPSAQIVALSATVANPDAIADWLSAELIESTWRPVDLRTGVYDNGMVAFDDGTELILNSLGNTDADADNSSDATNGDRPTEATVELVIDAIDDGGQAVAFVRSRREAESLANRLAGQFDSKPTVDFDTASSRRSASEGFVRDGSVVDGHNADAAESDYTTDDTAEADLSTKKTAESDLAEAATPGADAASADAAGADAHGGDAPIADPPGAKDASRIAREIESLDGTHVGQRLADCVRSGVAFHHAGLRSAHRSVIERAFRERSIACLCATPTLAAGVNLPARRVVVRDLERYTGSNMEWLSVLEVHQMCGRAGRPHLDPYGEAVLVGDGVSPDDLADRYVTADPESVHSNLADQSALRTHTLSLVATGFADTPRGVLELFDGTFYAAETPSSDLSGDVATVIEQLAEMELIRATGTSADSKLAATPLGSQVSKQYVRPRTGTRMVAGLETIARMQDSDDRTVTPLTVLEIVCDTPDMQDTYLGNRERADMYQYVRSHAAELTTDMSDPDDFEGWLESVKTARILAEWIDGATVESLVDSYRIGPGDLDSRIERAGWLLGAADGIADVIDIDVPLIESVQESLPEPTSDPLD